MNNPYEDAQVEQHEFNERVKEILDQYDSYNDFCYQNDWDPKTANERKLDKELRIRWNQKTIKWYKIKCSLFKEEFGVESWTDLIEFMKHTIGFDYIITGQTSEPFSGVEGYYKNGQFYKI